MEIELVRIFVKVIRSGSFTKAADLLRLPKSTVSKAITRLESETGTKLLVRTTRSQTLTAAGKAFYDSCVGPIQAIEDAQKSLSGNDSLLTGTIRITAPEDLGAEILARSAGVLTQKYPGLNFEFIYTDRVLDLVKDGFDLAIRVGHLKESGLKMKKIGETSLILVASSSYLKNKCKIHKPEDLKNHSCLSLTHVREQWPLRSSSGSTKVSIQARIVSNQMSSLVKASIAGGGVALVPFFLAQPYLKSSELVRVLPQWVSQGLPVTMLSPLPFSSSAKLRLTADHFASEVAKALEIEN